MDRATQASVLLLEPRPLLREGLGCVLDVDERVKVLGGAATPDKAEQMADRLAPDVVVAEASTATSLQPPQPSAGEEPASERPYRIVALALDARLFEDDRREHLTNLLEAGVMGFVSAEDTMATLVDAICAVAGRPDIWVSPRVAAHLAKAEAADRESAVDQVRLTEAERQLLALVAEAQRGHLPGALDQDRHASKPPVRPLSQARCQEPGGGGGVGVAQCVNYPF